MITRIMIISKKMLLNIIFAMYDSLTVSPDDMIYIDATSASKSCKYFTDQTSCFWLEMFKYHINIEWTTLNMHQIMTLFDPSCRKYNIYVASETVVKMHNEDHQLWDHDKHICINPSVLIIKNKIIWWVDCHSAFQHD